MKKTSTAKTPAATTSALSKKPVKKASPEPSAKKPAAPKTVKAVPVKEISIEKACKTALAKLKELNIDDRLQSEIAWCLGSYQNDKNPSGLYLMAKRALAVFTVELANGAKGLTPKFVADVEKAIGEN
jgi:hypothetical protein